MPEIAEILNQTWSIFRRAGIADDLTIIEHIAAILTDGLGFPDENLRPRKAPRTIDSVHLRDLLIKASELTDGDTNLFDRHVIMRISAMLPGGRYPTPRHIVNFMYQIAHVERANSIGDLACGSGGFLVRPDWIDIPHIVGTEISAEWARIAYANCLLHSFSHAKIEIGNALSIFSKSGPLSGESFDRILMNPPFGENIDIRLAKDVLGPDVGSRSETVLSNLALEKLKRNGRAGILVPTGLLFSSSKAEKNIRSRLIEKCQLEAVMSFPKDSFQPFSQLQTHLISIQKTNPEEGSVTWFLRLEKDGYPSGRSRDLTKEPELPSDLPLIAATLEASQLEWDIRFPEKETMIGIKPLYNQSNEPTGIIIGAISDGNISAVEIFPDVPGGPLVLVAARKDEGDPLWIRVHPHIGKAEYVEKYREYLQEVTDKRKVENLSRQRLPLDAKATKQLLFDHNNRFLGVAILQSAIKAPDYDLRPESYVRPIEEERALESPASILAEMRRNQKALFSRIDGLLGRLDMPPIAREKIPPQAWKDEAESLEPFGSLTEEQRNVWQVVCQKTQNWKEEDEDYATPIYFTEKDVDPTEGQEASAGTRSTLELFEKMGLIVRVNIGAVESDERIVCYRLASERDRWEQVGAIDKIESQEDFE
ncbi:MAG: class I SAM-dependent DNA methyltransferase [Candidatus Thorarchaeota archaeon]